MANSANSFIALALSLFVATSTVAMGEPLDKPRTTRGDEFKAVRFTDSEEQAARELTELAEQGWQYVGPLGNGLVAFRRSASIKVDTSKLNGEWEFLSVEKDGVVTEYKPEHRLVLSISDDDWKVGNLIQHRVEVAGRDLVFHRNSELTGDIPGLAGRAPPASIAFGMFELKEDVLTYCMSTAFPESAFVPGNSPVKKPTSFETKGTANVVYRLRKKSSTEPAGPYKT